MVAKVPFYIPESDAVNIVIANIRGPARGAIALGDAKTFPDLYEEGDSHGEECPRRDHRTGNKKEDLEKRQIRKTANVDQVSTLQSAAQSQKGVNARGQAQPVVQPAIQPLDCITSNRQFNSLSQFSLPFPPSEPAFRRSARASNKCEI
jgi:hypothetical protein